MRQRKIKDIENKLLAYSDIIVSDPVSQKGCWRELFSCAADDASAPSSPAADDASAPGSPAVDDASASGRHALYLEIGCGKGRFISESAKENPASFYLAAEGVASVVYRALDKVQKMELSNVRFITEYVNQMNLWFEDGELDGIFLNFSDPWPKARNGKRRLTHRTRLMEYSKALSLGGFIRIKTDNDGFFEFTLEEIAACGEDLGLVVAAETRDLHNSIWSGLSPMTEYEEKFHTEGKSINYLELKKVK